MDQESTKRYIVKGTGSEIPDNTSLYDVLVNIKTFLTHGTGHACADNKSLKDSIDDLAGVLDGAIETINTINTNIGDPSDDTLKSLTAKLGDLSKSLAALFENFVAAEGGDLSQRIAFLQQFIGKGAGNPLPVDTSLYDVLVGIKTFLTNGDGNPLAVDKSLKDMIDDLDTLIDTLQSDVTAIKGKTDNLPVDPASEGSVEGAITAAHGTTDGKIDAAQADITSIKGKTDNLPDDPADESAVEAAITAAHGTTDGKIDAVQSDVTAVKAKTDLIPAEMVGLLFAVGGGPYALSDDVLVANDPVVSKDSVDYVKVKEINVGYLSGTLRVAFDSRDPSGAAHWVHAKVYKNGVAVGTERSQNGDWYTYSEDLADFAKNDLLQLYVKNSDVGFPIEVRNFRILGKYPIPVVPAIVAVP